MFSKDLRAVLVTPQGVTLAPLSSCARALCQQPQGGLVGLPALLLGEVYRTMAPTFSWEEHPEIPRLCAVAKSSDHISLLPTTALPFTTWVALCKCQAC